MNLDDFSYEENGRRYTNPQVALDEENAFIQNLRDTQTQDNAKIYQDTHNLGTDISSNLGSLNGSEAYFNARYQTPQTNSSIANLRSAAQAKALSDAINNEIVKAKKRYQDAYYAAQKSSGGGSGNGGSGSGGDGDGNGTGQNEPIFENTGELDPNSTDTVERHTGDPTSQFNEGNAPAASNIAGMTGGSELPAGNWQKTAYLVSPDGRTRFAIGSNSSAIGAYWTAPVNTSGDYIDYENKNSFTSMLQNNWINNGWRVQLGNGRDITSTYGIYFSYF